jgi:hypothetical protein
MPQRVILVCRCNPLNVTVKFQLIAAFAVNFGWSSYAHFKQRLYYLNFFARIEPFESALSEQTLGPRAAVLASMHEQPVPIFQQLAGGHPSGRDNVREIPAVAAQRRGSFGRALYISAVTPLGFGGTGLARCLPGRFGRGASRTCAAILSCAGISTRSL